MKKMETIPKVDEDYAFEKKYKTSKPYLNVVKKDLKKLKTTKEKQAYLLGNTRGLQFIGK